MYKEHNNLNKTEIITATEYADGEQRALTIILNADSEKFCFPESIKKAVNDYLSIPCGKEYLEETNGSFNWGDVCVLPYEICKKHGFEIKDYFVSEEVVDWNEQLIEDPDTEKSL